MRVALIERQSETGETTVYAGTITSRTIREAAATLAAKENPDLLQVNTADQNEIARLMLQIESALTGQCAAPVVGDPQSDDVDPAIAAVWRDSIEAEFDTLKAG